MGQGCLALHCPLNKLVENTYKIGEKITVMCATEGQSMVQAKLKETCICTEELRGQYFPEHKRHAWSIVLCLQKFCSSW
jgi:hypothetical protein